MKLELPKRDTLVSVSPWRVSAPITLALLTGLLAFPFSTFAAQEEVGGETAAATQEAELDSPTSEAKTLRAESLYPASAKSLVIIRQASDLRSKLETSSLAELGKQDGLKPFMKELRRLLEEKLFTSGGRLGVSFADVKDIATGEIAFSSLLPDPDGHAIAMSADVTGREEKAKELIAKIQAGFDKREAKKEESLQEGDSEIVVYRLPWDPDRLEARIERVYLCLTKGHLLASNHAETMLDLVRSLNDSQPDEFKSFQETELCQAVTERLAKAEGATDTDIRWYMEPFGFSTAIRNTLPKQDRKANYLNILKREGFDAIQGLGGDLVFGHAGTEALHRTYIYAPTKSDTPADRFTQSARMLTFPNIDLIGLRPGPWVFDRTATYITFTWDMLTAFDSGGGLVDEIAGAEGAFDRMLKEMKMAPDGPEVDIRNELIANFEPRFTMITDIELPVDLSSERVMIALPLSDSVKVNEALDKIMIVEPGAKKKTIGNLEIWHIDPSHIEGDPDASLDPIFGGIGDDEDEFSEPEEDESSLAGWNSFCVHENWLLVSNHLEMISETFDGEAQETLLSTNAYSRVTTELGKYVGNEASFHQFGRMDEILRVPFELLRQGKMPESQSILSSILNRQLGSNELGELRAQEVSPDSLPKGEDAYDKWIKPFIGPSGWAGTTETDGWFFIGLVLPQDQDAQVTTPAEPVSDEAKASAQLENQTDGEGKTNGGALD